MAIGTTTRRIETAGRMWQAIARARPTSTHATDCEHMSNRRLRVVLTSGGRHLVTLRVRDRQSLDTLLAGIIDASLVALLEERAVGLSWQQGPISSGAIGRFLVPEPLPKRLLYVEPLRRRMRVPFGGTWIAESENVLVLFEPGRYPVAYFPETDVSPDTLQRTEHTTQHNGLGLTAWYTVRAGERSVPRGAWQHIELPAYASDLHGRVAFAWPAMDAFYEEDERIVGHAADAYHRIDIRQTSRHLVVRHRDRSVADTRRPLVLYESGFAPRWYVLRVDLDQSTLTGVKHQTFCPYKGLCSYYDIGDARQAAWSYREAYPEVGRISDLVSFEPDIVSVQIDGKALRLEPGQSVIPHGPDRDLTVEEALPRT
jgi:uncharacterized protein (DUF427 family)